VTTGILRIPEHAEHVVRIAGGDEAAAHDFAGAQVLVVEAGGDHLDHDIAVGEHADGYPAPLLLLDHDQAPDVVLAHQLRRFHERHVLGGEGDDARADLSDFHDRLRWLFAGAPGRLSRVSAARSAPLILIKCAADRG
jgi:hypothetical protein